MSFNLPLMTVSSPSTRIPCSGLTPSAFLRLVPVVLMLGLAMSTAYGETILLENANSSAAFNTEASDGGTLGLYDWNVDGTDHAAQQWFWYRIGDDGPEQAVGSAGSLVHLYSNAVDIDGVDGNDILLAKYQDDNAGLMVEVMYWLTGGTDDTDISGLAEKVRIINTGNSDLDFHLFQYANFDVNATANNDAVMISGSPGNTARQTDPMLQVSETVATFEPSHWQAGVAADLLGELTDVGTTVLNDDRGPYLNQDAAWAFQWDVTIPHGGAVLVEKSKSLRPGPHIPEPSAFALLAMGALGLLGYAWRRR